MISKSVYWSKFSAMEVITLKPIFYKWLTLSSCRLILTTDLDTFLLLYVPYIYFYNFITHPISKVSVFFTLQQKFLFKDHPM